MSTTRAGSPSGKRPVLREFRVCFRIARFLIGPSDYENIFQVQGILALAARARNRLPAPRPNTGAHPAAPRKLGKTLLNALATKEIPEFLQPVIECPLQRTFREHGGGPARCGPHVVRISAAPEDIATSACH
jgi:hypothetical protein